MELSVVTGIDRIATRAAELPRSAKLGLLTNQAARTTDGRWAWSVLLDSGYHLALLLTPEHGLAVDAAAGAAVGHSSVDEIPVLSLYGADDSPVEEAMNTIDSLVVDLPDVGCRYYTYAWTVRELLTLAARHDKPVHLLDRPNPLGGTTIEGNKPEDGHDSAVCASSVPVRHGLTFGELALWNRRDFGLDVDVSVMRVEGWRRDMTWFESGLPWIPPSPAIVDAATALFYPGTCLLEGTNVSEGRGTEAPFTMLGAPFLDGASLARDLSGDEAMSGAHAEPVTFTPLSSKWAGQRCEGVRLMLSDRGAFRPVRAGLAIVAALAAYPDFTYLPRWFDTLAGTSAWRESLVSGRMAAEIADRWRSEEEDFREQRMGVLMY